MRLERDQSSSLTKSRRGASPTQPARLIVATRPIAIDSSRALTRPQNAKLSEPRRSSGAGNFPRIDGRLSLADRRDDSAPATSARPRFVDFRRSAPRNLNDRGAPIPSTARRRGPPHARRFVAG
jgi:hypothetical protein